MDINVLIICFIYALNFTKLWLMFCFVSLHILFPLYDNVRVCRPLLGTLSCSLMWKILLVFERIFLYTKYTWRHNNLTWKVVSVSDFLVNNRTNSDIEQGFTNQKFLIILFRLLKQITPTASFLVNNISLLTMLSCSSANQLRCMTGMKVSYKSLLVIVF